jgi:HEAT repeat protein
LVSANLSFADDKAKNPPTIPDLIQQLSSNDFHVRQRAAKQLGNLGLAARDAVRALGKLLHDAYPDVRSSVAKALGKSAHRPCRSW